MIERDLHEAALQFVRKHVAELAPHAAEALHDALADGSRLCVLVLLTPPPASLVLATLDATDTLRGLTVVTGIPEPELPGGVH